MIGEHDPTLVKDVRQRFPNSDSHPNMKQLFIGYLGHDSTHPRLEHVPRVSINLMGAYPCLSILVGIGRFTGGTGF